jgi:hypothetical protein
VQQDLSVVQQLPNLKTVGLGYPPGDEGFLLLTSVYHLLQLLSKDTDTEEDTHVVSYILYYATATRNTSH